MLFAVSSLRGNWGDSMHAEPHFGTPCHYQIYFPNSFIFKNKIEKEGLPRDSPAGLGAGGPEFKSRRPDQNISRVFFRLMRLLSLKTPLWNSGRQEFSIRKSFSFREFAT